MALYDEPGLDGRATGRRWPKEYDRNKPEQLLPLVEGDGVVLACASAYGKTHQKVKTHLGRMDETGLTLCGRPYEEETLAEPAGLPLCKQCFLSLFSRRQWGKKQADWNAAGETLAQKSADQLRQQVRDLQQQQKGLLRLLAEFGVLFCRSFAKAASTGCSVSSLNLGSA